MNQRIVYFCSLFLFIFLIACKTPSTNNIDDNGASDIEAMTGVELSVSSSNEAPTAGEIIELNISLSPNEDMPQAQLSLILPQEATFPDGQYFWTGDLNQGENETVQVQIKTNEWPLSEPIQVILSDNISTFWVYWPDEPKVDLPERQRGTPETLNGNSLFESAEPSPSVAVTLQVDPQNPEAGQRTRFVASMISDNDFDQVSALFELPTMFQLESGSSLEWHGDLVQGVEQTVEIFATPTQEPDGEARFVLNTSDFESIFATTTFGLAAPLEPGYRPEGIADESDTESPEFYEDADLDISSQETAEPGSLPPVDLTVLESADDNNQVSFTVFIFANEDITNGRITLQPPSSFTLLDGSLEWQGNIKANELAHFELTFERQSNEVDALEIQFDSDQGIVAPFIHELNIPADSESNTESTSETQAPTGTFNLNGRFMYDENLTTARGIYFARVEVYDDDSGLEGGDDFVCQDTTDSNGYWSCSGSASDTFDNTVELYARVRAYNSNNGVVKESDGDEYRFKTANHNMSESGGSYNFGTWWPGTQGGNPQDGAFHIHKFGTYGNNTTQFLGGETPPIAGESHFITFTWPDTDSDSTSEYSGWNVRIEGPGSSDPDEWDESVILHEYGHYLMDHFATLGSVNYCNNPGETPPCGHSFNSHENPTTAYIEGYPNYYQSAVKRYYGLANAHMYIESSWSFNIETSWHSPTTAWDDAESTIAGILWDLNDAPDDDQNSDDVGDELNQNHQEIHDVFSNSPGGYGDPLTIHDFYNSFRGRYAYDNQLIRIYYEHGIDKDSTSPTGSISINSGATYATSTSVTLNLSASDPYPGTGVTQMRFRNSGSSWSSWQDYASTKSWTLPTTNGTRVVYVQYRDGSGNSSSSYSDSIVLDTIAPTNSTILTSSSHMTLVWSNDPTINVIWSSANDNIGVYGYGFLWDQAPFTMPSTIVNTFGTNTTSSALSSGDSYYFHLRTRDNAGNWSSNAVHLGPFYIDTIKPVSTVSNLPASPCQSFQVSWGGTDAHSGIATYDVQYRVGAGTWTTWLSGTSATSAIFNASSVVNYEVGETLYFRSRAIDAAGNVEAYPGGSDTSTTPKSCVYLPFVIK